MSTHPDQYENDDERTRQYDAERRRHALCLLGTLFGVTFTYEELLTPAWMSTCGCYIHTLPLTIRSNLRGHVGQRVPLRNGMWPTSDPFATIPRDLVSVIVSFLDTHEERKRMFDAYLHLAYAVVRAAHGHTTARRLRFEQCETCGALNV